MTYLPAIASLSLGRAYAGHSLEAKLSAASKAGFKGVECFYEDLEVLSKRLPTSSSSNTDAIAGPGLDAATSIDADADTNSDTNTPSSPTTSEPSPQALLQAAHHFSSLAKTHNLHVLCLQPFMHYEGLLSHATRAHRQQKLRLWFKLAKILGTDIIQVPSNFLLEGVTGDHEVIVRDLRWLADQGLKEEPVIRFAYENICWGTFISKWKEMWDVVKEVDRPNFGMCLDTFHLCGTEWADPASDSGTVEGDADKTFRESMAQVAATIDVDKVFYVQAADAERAVPPMRRGAGNNWWADGQQPRMTWSRNLRVFAFEERGYMPVEVALRAILDPPPMGLGYQGWVSMEVFSWTLAEKDENVPVSHAERAKKSWEEIQQRLRLDEKV
jgi:4-hydroxyphenylpyruvate dioxygenase